ACRYPEVMGRLVGRAMKRSRVLAVNMAIAHHAKVEVRLHMLFWHLAERWGRVTREGVSVGVRLPHHILADMVAAQRPSVTTALSRLAQQGSVEWTEGRWLLRGGPPGELQELTGVAAT
ncbi:MAG: helix-turn-helix domain-containing protein, partial [Actinomycetota bacterium]|nr:helix-turn-helix domain-containing protein [Actinomycetota bacterium]